MSQEKYAVWYATATRHQDIAEHFIMRDGTCRFEKDFHLGNRFVDYDHAIAIWYGDPSGKPGALHRDQNSHLEAGFDFLTSRVARLLEDEGIDRISYLFALPDFDYSGKVVSNGMLHFAGHVSCDRPNSDWLDDILNDM